ncbi:prenyltransferase/squalene oxidase repeat-containing protein [Cerasicoccus frondis]|uniref:prenyltransferase/squalene oxidase repeat-containing protein n=1 Tax=Cerasicoccus frondis TaxID=490090 RepID=UPI0028529408|nr:prenyltransferase/squalene oxidase repeat-containing protein [Cerasicoccus frondis]
MGDILTTTLGIIDRHLRSELFNASTFDQVRRTMSQLAPCYPMRMGFECRLAKYDDAVDVQQCFSSKSGEPQSLMQFAGEMANQPNNLAQDDWRRIHLFAQHWRNAESPMHEAINEFWLEFDQSTTDQSSSSPSVFFGFDKNNFSVRECLPITKHALVILATSALNPNIMTHLNRCAEACGDEGSIEHIGVMLSRTTSMLRVNINDLPLDRAAEFLAQIGWPGKIDDLLPTLIKLSAFADGIKLCLDIGEQISPNIGLECFIENSLDLIERWNLLLQCLVNEGLCSIQKKKALLEWPGHVDPSQTPNHWPDEAITRSLPLENDQFSALSREITHIKVNMAPDGQKQAKAYFGFYYTWLIPKPPDKTLPPPNIRIPSDRTSTSRQVIEDVMAKGLDYLLKARKPTGWWHDYADLGNDGPSDVWISAYVALVLSEQPDPQCQRAARWIWQLLQHRGLQSGGWGWSDVILPDADSTIWGLLLGYSLGEKNSPRIEAAKRFLTEHQLPSGGFACYIHRYYFEATGNTTPPPAIKGWFEENMCITAASSRLPEYSEQICARLRKMQQEDGHWNAYWWPDVEYSTMLATLGLAQACDPANESSLESARQWAAQRISPSGYVCTSHYPEGSIFATACCARILLQAKVTEAYREPLERALKVLIDSQLDMGCWPSSAIMYTPQHDMTLLHDARSVCTTATVIAALQAYCSQL